MRIPYFQVNAFTTNTFGGNPAGVCLLDNWLPDAELQAIAAENHFSETAFFTKETDHYHLRWFTPTTEVDLCGHATLAPAYVLFHELGFAGDVIRFQTRSGMLEARRRDKMVELNFPSRPPMRCEKSETLLDALNVTPREVLASERDYLVVLDNWAAVSAINPDMELLVDTDRYCTIVTAPGKNCDFVSRFFAPAAGIPEDPVTGSAHCTLIPYWAKRLGKSELFARQISQRGGDLYCRNLDERVAIAGHAVIYCRGEIQVPGGSMQ